MSGGAKGSPRDRLRSAKKPVTEKVLICLDGDVAEEWNAIEAEVTEARDRRDAQDRFGSGADDATVRALEDAEARLEALRPAFEESKEEFVFRSLGRPRFEALLDEHAPTDEQVQRNRGKGLEPPEFNPDSFPPVICHATCISHEWSIEDWKDLFADEAWNAAELTLLTNAAYTVNLRYRIVQAGKGSGGNRG
jgi:hypothetical protein